MSRMLGLDIGTNSIGWALTQDNELVSCGVRIFPTALNNKRTKQKQKRRRRKRLHLLETLTEPLKEVSIVSALWGLTSVTFVLVLFNKENWQFWLNLSLTILLATLTIIHQDKNK